MEVADSASDIADDLLAQSLRIGPVNFRAKAGEKGQFQGGLVGEGLIAFEGMEVEQVGFYGERDAAWDVAEGGAIPDVGDGFEALGGGAASYKEGRDVDTVCGEELRVGGQVDRRNGVAGAVAATRGGGASDGEGTAEEGACMSYVTSSDEAANAGGGDGAAAEQMRGVAVDAEAEFTSQGLEALHVCRGFVAEAEVFTFVDLADPKSVREDVAGELPGGEAGELCGEGEDEHRVETGGADLLELLRERGDERVGRLGAKDTNGVGIEGDGERLEREGTGTGVDPIDDPAVTAVDAVEVTDGGDDGTEAGGNLGEGTKDLHGASSAAGCGAMSN